MPIPKPKKNEDKDKFIERCMSDDKMNTEYTDNKQRLAICNVSWKDKNKKSRGNMAVDKEKFKIDGIERRFTPQTDAEIRVAKDDNDLPVIEGYYAKFGKLSGDLGGFREQIEKGFFRDALQGSDVIDLFNHDQNYPLGRESAPGPEGKLEVWEDEVGLRYKLTPLVTNTIRDMVLIPIEKKVIKGNSFGFRTNQDGDRWENDKDGMPIRTLKPGGCSSIFDGSQVLFPAYPDTNLALRSLSVWTNRDDETVKIPDDIKDDSKAPNKNVDGTEVTNPEDGTEVTNPKDKKDEAVEDKQEQKINLDVPVNLKLNVTVEQESKEVKIEDDTKVEPLEDDSKDESDPSNENVDGDDSSNDEVNDNQQASDENVNEDENNSDDEQKPSEAEILAKQRDREVQLKKKHITLEEF